MDLQARPVQFKGGSALARGALKLMGWRIAFDGLPSKQGVMIVYPHTSNWDFPFGLLTKWATGMDLHFWGKDSLFTTPILGRFMRAVGGLAVERSHPQGQVGAMVEQFNRARIDDRLMWLVIAPEGTRKLSEGWRSGFYHLAVDAGVPLAIATIDYASKTVGVLDFVELSGSEAQDMTTIAQRLKRVQGLRPHQASPIRLKSSRASSKASSP